MLNPEIANTLRLIRNENGKMQYVPKLKNGGQIQDQQGYLASNLQNFTPKKVIKGNKKGTVITTDGMLPNFPILANGQMLFPNTGNYYFPESSVTEYPVMQTGGRTPLPIINIDRIEPTYVAPMSAINPKTGKTWRTGDGSGRDYCHSCVEEIKELPDEFKEGSKWGAYESEYNLITGKAKIPYNFEKLQSSTPDWFSRPLYNSERPISKEDVGKREYFDKKTGRSIGVYENGGELPEAGSGYKVVRSSERKGKTHKVTGTDGTVKFFGDSKLGQHPKDPARKAAFYARHKKNLAGNPYFRAFARKTWEEGGELNEWEILDTAQDGRSLTSSELASRFRPEDAYQRSPIKFENIGNKSYGFGIRPNNFNISGVLDLQNKENPTFRTALGYNKNGLNINIAPSFSKDKKEAIFTAGYDGRDWSGNLMYQDPSKFNLGFGYNKAGFSGNANYERQGKNNVFNTSIGYEGEDVPINAGLDYTYDNGHYASANLGFNAKNIRGGFNYDYDQSEKANRFGLNLGTNFGKNKKWALKIKAHFIIKNSC
jgi:hypothetical protein